VVVRRIAVVVFVAVLAACSHGSHASEGLPTTTAFNGIGTMLNANYECRTYVPGPVVDAVTTTVQAFRDLRIGPSGPDQHRFPGHAASEAAAWCWTGRKGAYNVYEVVQDGTAVKIGSNVGGTDAHGAPVIP
jgi:hypothetical protein